MASSDSLPVPRKNTAYRVYFPILKNDGSIITSWTSAAATISKDGGASASTTNTPTEIATSWGIGYLDLTSTEMNADAVILKATVTNTGALAQVIVLYPQEAGDIHVNVDASDDKTNYQLADNAITAAKIATDAIGSAQLAASGVSEIQSGLPTVTQIRQEIDTNSTQLARIAAKTDLITTDNFTVIAPVDPLSGDLTLVRGDDYTATTGRPLPSWSSDDWTVFDLTHSEDVLFRARARYGDVIFEKAAEVLSGTLVRVQLTSAETGDFAVGHNAYDFDLQAVLASGDVVTLAQGHISIREDVR